MTIFKGIWVFTYEIVKDCTDMNETVNAPYPIDFGFGFWATLRREAFFGFHAY
jgi:hypothetical protein